MDANMVLPVQGWSFFSLMFTTLRLSLIRLVAPLLRATSTESFRGGCWLFAWPLPATLDVIFALKHSQHNHNSTTLSPHL